jgi:hypothetical protein
MPRFPGPRRNPVRICQWQNFRRRSKTIEGLNLSHVFLGEASGRLRPIRPAYQDALLWHVWFLELRRYIIVTCRLMQVTFSFTLLCNEFYRTNLPIHKLVSIFVARKCSRRRGVEAGAQLDVKWRRGVSKNTPSKLDQ